MECQDEAMQKPLDQDVAPRTTTQEATFSIVVTLSFAHLLNDMMQSLIPAIYPIIKQAYQLDFGQIGLITLAFQLTASMGQPLVGAFTDRHPQPYSLVAGMASTLVGLVVLAHAGSYAMLLLGAALIGSGSAVFHPESTRMARLASGGRHGFAQSMFQVGGQAGQAIVSWFSLVALIAMVLLLQVGLWYKRQSPAPVKPRNTAAPLVKGARAGVALAVFLLVLLMFSKNAYTASLTSYYTFYLIGEFKVSVQSSQ